MEKTVATLKPRMNNPALIIPEAMPVFQALGRIGQKEGTPSEAVALAQLRASQINGCSVCVDGHTRMMKASGETDERLFAVSAWRESPYFTEAERAALALSEAITRLSDRPDPVPDAVWDEAARHFKDPELAALVIGIAAINLWNRINVATRQVAGEWKGIVDPGAAKKWGADAARKWAESGNPPKG
jgi:AhpD family alkylhydroperoxidase